MADERRTVFVSFSKRDPEDSDFIRYTLARLSDQPLTVWVYEERGEEIPVYERIDKHLQLKIDESRVFIPLVTQSALESRYTQLEVAYALSQSEACPSRLIFPVVSSRFLNGHQGHWIEPFRELQDRRFHIADFDDLSGIEEILCDLCRELSVSYVPHLPDRHRLPVRGHFLNEIRTKLPCQVHYEVGTFRRMMSVLGRFTERFNDGDFAEARRSITYLCELSRYEFQNANLFYPFVVKGLCDLKLDEVDAAERTLRELLEHPQAGMSPYGETVHGALGQIMLLRRDYAAAERHYQEAHQLDPDDAAAASGLIMTQILCGKSINRADALQVLDRFAVDEEGVPVRLVRAIVQACTGSFSDGAREFEAMLGGADDPAAWAVMFIGAVLERSTDIDIGYAVHLLEGLRTRSNNPDVWYLYARCFWDYCDASAAVEPYLDLVRRFPEVGKYRVEAACVLRQADDPGAASKVLDPLLKPRSLTLPVTANDLYYEGFAHWLVGDRMLAEHLFLRSQFPDRLHYRNNV